MAVESFPGSTRVEVARYDEDTQVITVRFPDGVTWEYRDVPEDVWIDFTRAASPGKFLNEVLGTYDHGAA